MPLQADEIFGGIKVNATKYPFIARLFIPISGRNGLTCTGSLVTKDLILTAKHCFEYGGVRYKTGKATFNDTSRKKDKDEFSVSIKLFKEYPNSDLALAKLTEEVQSITPVRINKKKIKPGMSVRTVGYGMNGPFFEKDNFDGHLRDIDLQVSYVKGVWIGTKVGKNMEGPCAGDSGGPLLVESPYGWSVVAALYGAGYDCRTHTVNGDDRWSSVRALDYNDLGGDDDYYDYYRDYDDGQGH